jgi:hypothetical protein
VSPAERERIRDQVRESRSRQGLPAHVQDISLLDRLAGRLLERVAGNDDRATQRDQGRGAASVATASGAGQGERRARSNSKGPGLTNRDLRQTTPRTSKEVIGA